MNLSEVITELRELNEPVPKPFRLQTEAEINLAEKRLNVKFHEDYRRFLLEASDVVVGTLEPRRTVSEGADTARPKSGGLVEAPAVKEAIAVLQLKLKNGLFLE